MSGCEINDSGSDTDSQFSVDATLENSLPTSLTWLKQLRSNSIELPETSSLIQCENGTKVYLCGTAHFSLESIDDIMKQTHPDFVLVELCKRRSHMLVMDEEQIKNELKDLNIYNIIRDQGFSSGILQYLLLQLNAYLVSTLGMAPGGEFRAAFAEARKQSHCHIILGDRPINITLYRAFDSLNPWTKLRFLSSIILNFQPITKEQIEEMKNSDILEKLSLEMAGDHPHLTRILLEERDKYLARSIWEISGMEQYTFHQTKSAVINSDKCTDHDQTIRERYLTSDSSKSDMNNEILPGSSFELNKCCSHWPSSSVLPRVVVAVVGIGHISGIKKYFPVADSIDKAELSTILPVPLSWKIFKWIFRGTLLIILSGSFYGLVRGSYIISRNLYSLTFST